MREGNIEVEDELRITKTTGGVCAPHGFKAAGVACGIKESGKPDMALLTSEAACTAAVVITPNAFVAAPVTLTKSLVDSGRAIHALVVNSGNANACTGEAGVEDSLTMAESARDALGLPAGSVLVNSTGVIGHKLPMEKVKAGISLAARSLEDNGASAASAILTTDSHPKEAAYQVTLDGRLSGAKVTVGGMAKGAGMIAPNMATMIAVITTDAPLDAYVLNGLLREAVGDSFNQISVDGCQSTNDMVVALANGAAAQAAPEVWSGTGRAFGSGGARARQVAPKLTPEAPELAPIAEAFKLVARDLAKMIARDGEGATHLIEVQVTGAASDLEAKKAALAVVSSDLVKCAFFGKDPNWGRILAAVGGAQVAVDPRRTALHIEGTHMVDRGEPVQFDAAAVSQKMKRDPVHVTIDLGVGGGSGVAWGCDMTYDYVKINAEYTT